jgi:hypothetical protein
LPLLYLAVRRRRRFAFPVTRRRTGARPLCAIFEAAVAAANGVARGAGPHAPPQARRQQGHAGELAPVVRARGKPAGEDAGAAKRDHLRRGEPDLDRISDPPSRCIISVVIHVLTARRG